MFVQCAFSCASKSRKLIEKLFQQRDSRILRSKHLAQVASYSIPKSRGKPMSQHCRPVDTPTLMVLVTHALKRRTFGTNYGLLI